MKDKQIIEALIEALKEAGIQIEEIGKFYWVEGESWIPKSIFFKSLLPLIRRLAKEMMGYCDNCKYVKKVFDGIYGETWTCPHLKRYLSILNVGMDKEEREKFDFEIEYGFGCIFYEPNPTS